MKSSAVRQHPVVAYAYQLSRWMSGDTTRPNINLRCTESHVSVVDDIHTTRPVRFRHKS